MRGSRHHAWTDVAALDEHLTVFLKLDEALEGFLVDFASSSHEPYRIQTDSGTIERSSRAQISDAVDSLGGSLRGLEVWYTDPHGGRNVSMTTQPFAGWPLYRIGCTLLVFGDDENETNGRFDTLRNRMDAEIQRRWPKEATAVRAGVAPASVTLPAATRRRTSGFKPWLDGFLRHPIVAILVATGLLALIGVLWKMYS
jgi:hypothetical protein